jgi:hypothetical protein
MPVGKLKRLQRAIGRIYLLLTKEAAVDPSIDYLEDFRAARRLEKLMAPERASVVSAWENAAGLTHKNHRPPCDRD